MADTEALRRTPLFEAHVEAGAKLVPFGGWEMPLQYQGIIAEHMAVRTRCGLFDVSHMGQLSIDGHDAIARAQQQLSNDLSRIPDEGMAQYSMLLDEGGGIEDDVIAYRFHDDEILLVVNAANVDRDALLLEDAATNVSDRWAMLALQGPEALDVAAQVLDADVRELPPFRSRAVAFDGRWMLVATTGYTGERGCEILLPPEIAPAVWSALLADDRVAPCGLGARDTLRLEACYPLHGNDIGPDRDPVSAGLGFAAPVGFDGGAPGHAAIAAVREAGPLQKLVPVLVDGRGIPRAGTTVHVGDAQVGTVSSGTMSPVLRTGIALAWIDAAHAEVDTPLELDIRGTRASARVAGRPFVRGSL